MGGGGGAQSEVFKAFRALRWLQRGVTTRPKEGELPGESVAKEFSLQETDSDSCPLTKGGGAHLYFCIYDVYVFSTFFYSLREAFAMHCNPCQPVLPFPS